ncbi:MAG: polyribonucleotide nucleotidyltransferase [Planctomycetota bacterium]
MNTGEVRIEKEIAGRTLILETGRIAKQADGAVMARYGDTVILASAQGSDPIEGRDFLPLFVDYREKFQAAGKIPGGRFYKREGRPTLKEILTMRMIDRPLRPMFPPGYRNEVQIMAMVLSADGENDPDTISMIGATAALCLSSMPFDVPLGIVRVGRVDGQLFANPTNEQLAESDLELVLVFNGDKLVMMEAEASEVPEEEMLEAIRFARPYAVQVGELIAELTSKCGRQKPEVAVGDATGELSAYLGEAFAARIEETLAAGLDKTERCAALKALREEAAAKAVEDGKAEAVEQVGGPFDSVVESVVRRCILEGRRSDGRAPGDLRPVWCEVGTLPRTHGSAIFTRGETQVLATVTLGTRMDEEMVESLGEDYSRKFMLHYNFPPFSVGEVKPIRGPSRRDIGHGALAEKALRRILPDEDDFPYTIRIVSDVMESNGSSSMATVCGATLALMDAGIGITHPVAGISVGLVSEGDRRVILTDIQGEEDSYGDMDFKVAGTQNGILAIQVDIKADGLSDETIEEALAHAKEARIAILRQMLAVIEKPRAELSAYAPKLVKIKINPDKIGMVIGSGGKVVRKIQEDTGATIALEDDGTVTIYGTTTEAIEAAKEAVQAIAEEPEVGKIYKGRVRGIKDFGAFVEILPGTDGLLHISELDEEYVSKVTDFVRMGDEVTVKCIDIDDQGKIRLSRKAALKELQSS